MNNVEIKITGTLSFNNVLNFSIFSSFTRHFFSVLFLLAMVMSYGSNQHGPFYIFVPVFSLIFYYWAIRRSIKKSYKSNKVLQSQFKYLFSSKGVDVSFESGSSTTSWNDIYKVVILKDLIAIFISSNQSFIIPKSWFSSSIEIENFENVLTNSLPKNKIKKKTFFIF